MTNDNPVLGEIIENDERRRDAVHVAIAPVVANCDLAPGQPIGLVLPGENIELVGPTSENIGIVDPFLKRTVQKDDRFWMLLYPNSVVGMRHFWRHPAFNLRSVKNA